MLLPVHKRRHIGMSNFGYGTNSPLPGRPASQSAPLAHIMPCFYSTPQKKAQTLFKYFPAHRNITDGPANLDLAGIKKSSVPQL